MQFIQGSDRNQTYFATLEDNVGTDNPVRLIDAFIDKLNLDKLGFTNTTYKSEGRPPYAPEMLLKLYLYGYLNKIRSSHKLEKECIRNTELQWLLQSLQPNYHTIADFRKVHAKPLQSMFKLYVQFLGDAGLLGKINVALIDRKIWKGDEYENENLKSYQYKIDDSGKFALLTFNTFYDLDAFRPFLSEIFSNIKSKKKENLIIDIRNNNGGNSDLGDELLKYISTSPFTQYDRTYLKFSKIYKETFAKYSSLSKDSLVRYLNKKKGFIDTIRKSNLLIQPRLGDERFGRNVFLLTSPYTYSSAADFANAFKYYHLGKIVGEETGGYIISPGEGVVTKLPRSKINVQLSSSKDFDIGASDDDWHGVKPDYKVKSEEALNYVIKNLIK